MSTPAKTSKSAKRLCLLIPLLAIGVIAPTACYYEDYGYPASGQGHVYKAAPYGSYSSRSQPYPPRTQPYPYQRSSPYGYNYNSRYDYGGGSRHSSHEYHEQRSQAYQQAAKRQEQAVESRRESSKEGWQYEDRNERRPRGNEEPFEERKKR